MSPCETLPPPAPARLARAARVPLDRLELDELWPRRGTVEAREELVRRFLPLARRLASRYRSINEPMEDLVQIASLALLRAIDRFESDRGVSFVSYAIPTILGELKRHFRNTGWSAHVPRGAQEIALRVDHAVQELTAPTGRSPSVQAIATHLQVDVEEVLVGLDASTARYSTSLETPVAGTDGDPQTVLDILGGEDPRLDQVETTVSLAAALPRLPHLERQALNLRLGQGMKQTDIARDMGCSQMQVSRLLRRAVDRLQAVIDPDLGDISRG